MDISAIEAPETARQNDPLWKVEDVAGHLGVSQPTVRNYIRTRGLPYKRVGRHLRFRPAEVAAWVDAQRDKECAA